MLEAFEICVGQLAGRRPPHTPCLRGTDNLHKTLGCSAAIPTYDVLALGHSGVCADGRLVDCRQGG